MCIGPRERRAAGWIIVLEHREALPFQLFASDSVHWAEMLSDQGLSFRPNYRSRAKPAVFTHKRKVLAGVFLWRAMCSFFDPIIGKRDGATHGLNSLDQGITSGFPESLAALVHGQTWPDHIFLHE